MRALQIQAFYALVLALFLTTSLLGQDQKDLVIADFESGTYDGWTIEGTAFGQKPASGAMSGQMPVEGFRGKGLVNTFFNGDRTIGTATSDPFKIKRTHISFLIGGGPHRKSVGIELLVNGRSVRSSTGSESETLAWANWDVSQFAGKGKNSHL